MLSLPYIVNNPHLLLDLDLPPYSARALFGTHAQTFVIPPQHVSFGTALAQLWQIVGSAVGLPDAVRTVDMSPTGWWSAMHTRLANSSWFKPSEHKTVRGKKRMIKDDSVTASSTTRPVRGEGAAERDADRTGGSGSPSQSTSSDVFVPPVVIGCGFSFSSADITAQPLLESGALARAVSHDVASSTGTVCDGGVCSSTSSTWDATTTAPVERAQAPVVVPSPISQCGDEPTTVWERIVNVYRRVKHRLDMMQSFWDYSRREVSASHTEFVTSTCTACTDQ